MRFTFAVMTFVVASPVVAHAAGDPTKGASIFHQCAICHTIGPNASVKLGPPLNGVAGQAWAAWPGYPYSAGLVAGRTAGKAWDDATLNQWLTSPQKMVPGTKMAFGGIQDEQQRADVVAYLSQFKRNGVMKQQ